MSRPGPFHSVNLGWVIELHDRYLRDPGSVDPASRALFESWDAERAAPAATSRVIPEAAAGAVRLAQAVRQLGHLAARLDPLGAEPPGDPALSPEAHGLTGWELESLPASLVDGSAAAEATGAGAAIRGLRVVYCSTIGFDFEHVHAPEERLWLRDAAESRRFRPPEDPIDPVALLERLTAVEAFERFLHRSFPGRFRFSLEGLDMLVPMLDEVVGQAAEGGIRSLVVGMSHRGRLNVLAHVLGKPYGQILAEFRDPVRARRFPDELGWTGDVKYHMGARRAVKDGRPLALAVIMPPNPSHVEAIDPVVVGMARAAGTRTDRAGAPRLDARAVLPVLIHGDAAFPGQGVVAETLNLSRLPGYSVGGTLHVIANNQLGYTTAPEDAFSALYASDTAKGFEIPVVHVNADDPEACIEAIRIAFAYRSAFRKDFVIDLVGYRRHGHNESDEPAFTQPLMYRSIAEHPTVREQWGRTLAELGLVDGGRPEGLLREALESLQGELDALEPERQLRAPRAEPPPPGAARRADTGVRLGRLEEIGRALLELPEGFRVHRKIERARKRRREIFEDPDRRRVDWAAAEELALATILADGTPVRLTGQDAERGTFSQRHAVLHDAESGEEHVALQSFPQARAAFAVHNSPLTENAALGFELGCDVQAPERLVVWEAQYGDFSNGAQVVIDEMIGSARAKWGQTPALVLLLPHGHEGHGPDHTSARPERILQSCAGGNLRVANCTTAAQYFHLLRMQAALLDSDPLPLVVLTPKGLLRHPATASTLRELAEGRFRRVIEDEDPERRRGAARLVLCSGKLYADLVTSELREESGDVSLCRLEQLYPLPDRELAPALERSTDLEEVVWAQEEPENMGAWTFLRPRLEELIGGRWPLRFVGRPASSSPAEGSSAWHARNQEALVESALRRRPQEATGALRFERHSV